MSRRLLEPNFLAAIATSGVAAFVLIWRWDPIAAGHPSYLIFYSLVILLGVLGAGTSLGREGPRRALRSTLAAIGFVVLALVAWWLAPFPADPVAVEALTNPIGYQVIDSASSIVLEPVGDASGAQLTFYPGARVDARAYGHILSALARTGHEVTILKPPLGIALLVFAVDAPEGDRPWVVGGHSLGGVAASAVVGRGADGLLLWASFPASDISRSLGLEVSSIFATGDTIATPAEIEASAPDLPDQSVFVAVDGGIHSFFGDYGIQPGDGEPTVSRNDAQDQIVSGSLELLEALVSS